MAETTTLDCGHHERAVIMGEHAFPNGAVSTHWECQECGYCCTRNRYEPSEREDRYG